MLHVPLKRLAFSTSLIPALGLLTLSACSPPPKPHSNPMYDDSSALGVQLKMRGPVKFVSHEPEVVAFVRLEEGLETQETFEIYGSTYVRDGVAYLMNVEPGTYAIVGAFYGTQKAPSSDSPDSTVQSRLSSESYRDYSSCELIEATRVDVPPGRFVYVGRIVADESMIFGKGDACQRHFKELIEGVRSGWSEFFSSERALRIWLHEKDDGPEVRREFFQKAREHFEGTGWVALIEAESSRVR